MSMQRKAHDLQNQLKTAYDEVSVIFFIAFVLFFLIFCGKYQAELEIAKRELGFNANDAIQKLQNAKNALDDQSEEIGRKFVDKEIELSAFLKVSS